MNLQTTHVGIVYWLPLSSDLFEYAWTINLIEENYTGEEYMHTLIRQRTPPYEPVLSVDNTAIKIF